MAHAASSRSVPCAFILAPRFGSDGTHQAAAGTFRHRHRQAGLWDPPQTIVQARFSLRRALVTTATGDHTESHACRTMQSSFAN